MASGLLPVERPSIGRRGAIRSIFITADVVNIELSHKIRRGKIQVKDAASTASSVAAE